MKKIIFFILLLIFIGCVSEPARFENEENSCYYYRYCLFMVMKGKLKSDCKAEFIKCCKDDDYTKCKKEYPGDDNFRNFTNCFNARQ